MKLGIRRHPSQNRIHVMADDYVVRTYADEGEGFALRDAQRLVRLLRKIQKSGVAKYGKKK